MTRRRVPRCFRAAALLAVLGMVLGWMEATVPDVHDGHGNTEPETGAWVQFSHGHPPASSEEPGHAPQSPHTCHCIHAHAPALPAVAGASLQPASQILDFSATERVLVSFAPEPHFRPPVA